MQNAETPTPLRIVVDPNPEQAGVEQVRQGLIGHNVAHSSIAEGQTFAIYLRDGMDRALGGIVAWRWGECVEIEYVWIDVRARGQGYGRTLLDALEAEAQAHGCHTIVLDTYSFQAPEFYHKAGYQVMGVAEGYPQGVSKYFMKKTLG